MSKEKQLNEIIEIVKPFVSGCACEEESGSCELTDCRNCNAINLANRLQEADYRKQEWISVEERLPEHEENVLVAVDYEHIRATGVYISSLLERRQGERWTHKGYTVTHWMPLPEAPKMKGGAADA